MSDRMADIDESEIVVTREKSYAAGVPSVLVSLRWGLEQIGPGAHGPYVVQR
ncbi:hypothetical protein [Rhodococcus opacus]|uniref:hypothetical protein n=1 Tax=Rhodococcus opacus TaxID=37919 RepID=UPI00294990C2|nr:hypothetical protein [Rhodococcus opacus]MDV6247373.1 hypothetical protein [Rhodococcus opacus]